jgi:hypothetical protein
MTMMAEPTPRVGYIPFSLGDVLDESITPSKNVGLTIAQNLVYRRFGSYGKRCGSAPYGGGPSTGLAAPVQSGFRWHRGVPSALAKMVVQSGDNLYSGNDGTGAMTFIGALAGGSTPAFFCSAFDPAESGVGGTPASDILIVCYGSGPPMKWDGTNFTQLSPGITNHFTGCVYWHEHVWFWGDPNNPDTVFATDLGNPESYTFSTTFGGYQIARGDGDPMVQVCIPIGSFLYVFKQSSAQVITGYDQNVGDYQFQLSPAIDQGCSNGLGVQVLNGQLIWWQGQNVFTLTPGSQEPTPIGTPITYTCAAVANRSQAVIRSFAGDIMVQTIGAFEVYTNVFLLAVDGTGGGVADTILMFDADASQLRGKPAWTKLTGTFRVGAFIGWDIGNDIHALYIGDSSVNQVWQFGGHPTADVGANNVTQAAIPMVLQTGRSTGDNPDLIKRLNRAYMDVESNAAAFIVTCASDQNQSSTLGVAAAVGGTGGLWGQNWGAMIWGSSSGQIYQSLEIAYAYSVVGYNFTFTISESSTSSAYEIVGLSYRAISEGYRP